MQISRHKDPARPTQALFPSFSIASPEPCAMTSVSAWSFETRISLCPDCCSLANYWRGFCVDKWRKKSSDSLLATP